MGGRVKMFEALFESRAKFFCSKPGATIFFPILIPSIGFLKTN
jgi:hypothetical protein